MLAHLLLGQMSWNLHFVLKHSRKWAMIKRLQDLFQSHAIFSRVHLFCFQHALLSKSGCFRTIGLRIMFLPASHCGAQRCCQVQQERVCPGKNATLGVPRNLYLMMKNIFKKMSKTHHVPSPQERNPPLNAKENWKEIYPLCFKYVLFWCFRSFPIVGPSINFYSGIRLQDPTPRAISTHFLSSSREIIPTTEWLLRVISFFEVEGPQNNKKLFGGSLTVGVP